MHWLRQILPFMPKAQQICLVITMWLGGFISCLVFVQNLSKCSTSLTPVYRAEEKSLKQEKPILLLWFWPENFRFDFSECKTIFNIDDCILTEDRNLYDQADNVLIYHKSISHDLSNLPKAPRPPFQRWIWFHLESPHNTARIPGLENLFNLTLTYRRDSDIAVRYWLEINRTASPDFVIPKKDKLVCWFVSNQNIGSGIETSMAFYNEFKKHIDISIFGGLAGARLPSEKYYSTMASCKFYLSFENSIHMDYITEKVNGPVSSGTVPVVLGPPRQNYEQFYPPDSFIHVNDFPTAEALAKHLLQLDKDDAAYRRYFDWRKHMSATPHLVVYNQEFDIDICGACRG